MNPPERPLESVRPAVLRLAWALAGLLVGVSGLAVSYLVASVMAIRESPVVAVAEMVVRLTPGAAVEGAISAAGSNDKPLLVAGIWLVVLAASAALGLLARRRWWLAAAGFAVLALLAAIAVLSRGGSQVTDVLPVLLGLLAWLVGLSLLAERLRRFERAETHPGGRTPVEASRRGVLIGLGAVAVLSAAAGGLGRLIGRGRRQVEETRRLLRLAGVTAPDVPPAAELGVEGLAPWMTPADDFYLIDTAIIKPTVEPSAWSLRIHGMVENELTLSFEDLAARETVEGWVTLNCVSNEVGGDLIGNAWWSGARLSEILAEAGPLEGADAVLQTSSDGWTCGTPLEAMTDGRNAMLATSMNGEPLPIDHGFPVRTIVPGLYGYVSATKWVVDLEVSRFSDISAFWTDKGWGELGPVKMSSRIDVPRNGSTVPAGQVTLGGVAWAQHTGIAQVEVALDGGEWRAAQLADRSEIDAWVQWKLDVEADAGNHLVRVRATDADGVVQTGAVADVLPDGATGWHTVEFEAA